MLDTLPKEILLEVDRFLDSPESDVNRSNLSLVNTSIFHTLQPNRLIKSIICGNQQQAERMIAENPSLLLKKGVATDFSNRLISGTPLQVALAGEAVLEGNEKKSMVAMIREQFSCIDSANDIMQQQIDIQFPANWEIEDNKRHESDLKALNTVYNAIISATKNDQCDTEISTFKSHMDNQYQSREFTTGRYFNHQLILAALKLYVNHYTSFRETGAPQNTLSSRKLKLFWCNIIGYIQRYLPATSAIAFGEGTYRHVDDQQIKSWTIKFKNNEIYFPLDATPKSIPINSPEIFCNGGIINNQTGRIICKKGKDATGNDYTLDKNTQMWISDSPRLGHNSAFAHESNNYTPQKNAPPQAFAFCSLKQLINDEEIRKVRFNNAVQYADKYCINSKTCSPSQY